MPGPLAESRDVVINAGSTIDVARTLRDARIIDTALPFVMFVWATRSEGALRAAEYRFPPGATVPQVVSILRTARPVEHLLTIPEGVTASQVKAILDRTSWASGSVDAITEGSILPETYAFERGTPRTVILSRAYKAMERELQEAWASRDQKLPLASPTELLTLASIVERETALPSERAKVAAVYLNRLRLGMKLQADPTVVYAASNGTGVLDRKLTKADLNQDSPYNTYRYPGLPPGPICSPSAESLQAVAHPVDSADLFFVADGRGGHVFAQTAEAHFRNVARWRMMAQPSPPSPTKNASPTID
ncbi:MAG: endolytic transglycosylase MltG [Acetobacteraceae bacterium]